MDHPTIMALYDVLIDPIFRVFLIAMLGLSVAFNWLLWKERLKIIKAFGEKTYNWIIGEKN